MKCFLIPYAGGSSYVYLEWKPVLEKYFQPHLIELPGRGTMYKQPFARSAAEAADNIAEYIIKTLEKSDEEYIIFGHSMGALIAYETYYKLREKRAKLPKHIFFSSKEAPQVENAYGDSDLYNDKEFIEIVAQYGGLPDLFYEEEMLKVFLPVLRADFRVLSHYIYKEKEKPIQCDISILFGAQDTSLQKENLLQWKQHAGKGMDIYEFEGGHFYLKDGYQSIIELMAKTCMDN